MPPLDDDVARWLAPGRFVSARPLALAAAVAERTRWEVFQGRLLDESHTREERTFTSWNLQDDRGPVLSLKLDAERGELHVVRFVESYVHEGYDSGGGVFATRERQKPVRELIATFGLAGTADLGGEVTSALARAVTGTRLPLTPAEAPLPAFSFGRLYYHPDEPEPSRELEFDLRSRPPEEMAAKWASRPDLFATLRQVFLDVSLSPYTDFVDRVLAFLARLEPVAVLDFEAWLLRLVARHLTAYDLVMFHHRGANYPDAVLLDAVLADFLARLEQRPELFEGDPGIRRRSALRQAYVLRRRYEEHPVPDVPTSPGEHARVYPDGYPRVPEEQILQTNRRRKRLFAGDPLRDRLTPLARDVIVQSVADLAIEAERLELGAAVYLDRPFGGGKGAVAADPTPALASLAYSRSVATQRLRLLETDLGVTGPDAPLGLPGLPLDRIGGPVRQGTVSLADAARCAGDFVFRRTLPASIRGLLGLFDFGEFAERLAGRVLLTRSASGPGVVVYDEQWRARLEFEPALERGYAARRGVDVPAAGLRVTHVNGAALGEPVAVPPTRR
jgi:hypothetical protein